MLNGVKLEFVVLDEGVPDLDMLEGTIIQNNEDYICISDGDVFSVYFKRQVNNQVLLVKPDVHRNLDPDGGSSFMCRGVIQLIDSLITTKKYVQ